MPNSILPNQQHPPMQQEGNGGGGGGGCGGSTTIAATAVDPPLDGSDTHTSQPADDQPPGSLQIPIDQARDLISPVLHRDGSTRDAPSTPTPMFKPIIPPSSSRRLSSSSTRGPPPLLSLPHLARSARRSTRCPASPHAHLVPRDLDKAHPPSEDPSSPKVSCFGKVHSNKKAPPERPPFCHSCSLCLFSWCFCSCGRRKGAVECVDEEEGEEARKCAEPEPGSVETHVVAVVEPPVLGGMKRFASRRRSAMWANEYVERSQPSDGCAGMLRGQQLDDVDRARDGKATPAHADHDPPR